MVFNKSDDRVYVRDDQFEWLPAVVLEVEDDRVLVRIELPDDWNKTTFVPERGDTTGVPHSQLSNNDNEVRWVLLKDYYNHRLPLQNARLCRDMAELEHLHEAAILYQIKERHCNFDKPYTRVGEIIVAVNPCQWMHGLYSAERQQVYLENLTKAHSHYGFDNTCEEKKDDEAFVATSSLSFSSSEYGRLGCEPHIYEVSSMAYKGLTADRKDQTILVSGESGAGKTESVKIVLKHLVSLRQGGTHIVSSSDDDLFPHLLESSPIFEAFGNAKTLSNNNSSRFGKVTKLHYAVAGSYTCLVGSSFDTYLLETSRVVSHVEGERNFHIFYQLLSAPSEVKKELLGPDWGEASVSDFQYLKEGENSLCVGMCDATLWEETSKALNSFGWDGSSLQRLMRALGIVLLIGNIAFEEETDNKASIAKQADMNMLALSLGISVDEMELALTQRTIRTAHDLLLVPYTPDQAKEACEALAKAIYAGIFASIVRQINILTSAPPAITGKHKAISLVDIFGFERFEVNRFEQLCINYANERLQQKYVLDNLRRHKIEYEAEGIALPDWKDIDNSHTVELFEGPSGLIKTLNEQCIRPNGSSEVFVFKVKHSNKNHRSLLHEKLQLRTEFGVKHFAGPVTYDASKFVERNTDKLPDFLISVAATSSNGLIAQELSEIMKDSHAAFNIVKKKTTHRTVIDKFSRQLKDLLASIDHSQTRYIRCIKPCEDLGITKRMDHQTVLRQLKCAGLITAIELSRETFPNKLPFAAVERRFIHLLPSSKLLLIKDMELHDKAQIIMSILFSPFIEQYRDSEFAMPFACGHTKVYFRAGALEALEIQRQECFATAASRIQQSLRKAVKERQYHRARIGVGRLQALYRGQVLTLMYTRKRQSATKIQACTRSAIQRARFLLTKESAFVITTWCLVVLTQLQYKRIQHAAKKLNTWSRMQLARARFHRFVLSVSIIQATIRDRMQRKHFSEKIQAATVVADWWRAVLVRLRYIRTKNASILMTSWTRSRLLRNRFCRVKLAVTLLQANARSRRMSLMYHGNKQAAKTILCWSQAILACRRFQRMRAAAAKATVWTRARLHRARFIRRQEAATVLTAWSRSRQERRRFHRLTLAANVVCARRRSQLKSRLDQENCAAAKLQARVRTHQQMQRYKNLQWAAKTTQLLNQEHSAAAKLQAHVRTRQQMKRHKDLRRADLAKSRSNRDEHSAAVRLQGIVRTHQHMIRYHETLKASKSTPIAQSEKAREPRSPPMIRSEIEVPGARPGRVSGPINTSDCILVPMQLLEQVELYKRQVDDLNNDIMHVTAEAELHTQEVEADFEDRLAEYEEEVLQLKQTIRCYEEEKISFKDEIAANVENVRNLKAGIRSMQEAHRDYLNKVMRAIENANSEHLKALEAVKRDRDARVNALTAEINRLKKERRKSHDRGEEKRDNDVYRLARKLEKLTSPDYITAMAEKSTLHSQPLEDYSEEKVSGKARKIIYRLEDIAAAAGTASSQDSMDGKERMQGLQQQLVIAYEEIERLQTEAGGARRHGDSLQKRGLRKIFDR